MDRHDWRSRKFRLLALRQSRKIVLICTRVFTRPRYSRRELCELCTDQKRSDYLAAWYARRRAAGVCKECSQKARPARTLCGACAQRAREREPFQERRINRARLSRTAKGLCLVCSATAALGRKFCAECLADFRVKGADTRQHRKAHGTCTKCGGLRDQPGWLRCKRCTDRQRRRRAEIHYM